jgi:protein-L-isoaspartate(D-aspartate) O-methyltransferase
LTVPRDRFVAPAFAAQSYLDDALPIGEGQTISKPSIVARMLEALEPAGQIVLEIGTGSGYATSLLSVITKEVYTIERIRGHSLRARRLVQSLGYLNVQYKTGDGGEGWPEMAPFTRILITAEADKLPEVLYSQLAIGGRMIVPLKGRLTAVTRNEKGPDLADLGPAAFVPFITKA